MEFAASRPRTCCLNTVTGYTITRKYYEIQIRQPIVQYLRDHKLQDRIRCICLIYGVPVRVETSDLPPEAAALYKIYSAAATKATYRVVIDQRFLTTVGQSFREPRTQELTSLSALFDPPPRTPINPPADFGKTFAQTHGPTVPEGNRGRPPERSAEAIHRHARN